MGFSRRANVRFHLLALRCVNTFYSNHVKDVETILIADAHHRDGNRFVVRAAEMLTAFLELEAATWQALSNL
jgi:hypothetical protein